MYYQGIMENIFFLVYVQKQPLLFLFEFFSFLVHQRLYFANCAMISCISPAGGGTAPGCGC